jgi:hypothetical protein
MSVCSGSHGLPHPESFRNGCHERTLSDDTVIERNHPKETEGHVRDLDDWMFHFEKQAGPRLSEHFGDEAHSMPTELQVRLARLREAEKSARGHCFTRPLRN